jgi:ArsR family transcriptional regulator
MKTKAPATSVDVMFRAFSDRTRLRLLHLLGRGGEVCVCDLVDVLGVPQPKVSRHLAYLRKAGLVKARKQGLWSYYRLAPAAGAFHEKLLECLTCCFRDVPELARDAERLPATCGTGCADGPAKCCDG